MTWIKTVPPAEADLELRRCYDEVFGLYPEEYEPVVPALIPPDGTVDSVVAEHSLIPQAMRHLLSGFGVLLALELPLSRRQHEMITTVVSALKLVAALRRDYRQHSLSEQDPAMLDYAAKLATQAAQLSSQDLDRLREMGFTDQAILQINLIACWFNYINRVADGLGVGREPA